MTQTMKSTDKALLEKGYRKRKTIPFKFSPKHKEYIRKCQFNTFNIAEGAVRAGKTIDNVYAFAHELKTTPDRIHLATGSTMANAKLNIGDANGFGLEWIFRGQCRWGQYKGNDCLYICGPATKFRTRIVIFAGGAFSDSFKKIRGNSYGMWIATEINLHHDSTIKEAFNRQLAAKRRRVFWDLNPDHPKAPIYTDYIDKYAELDRSGKLLGGYNYEHFTIYDNVNISEERKKEILSQYDEESIWFIRDILGKRTPGKGIIYAKFASVVQSGNNTMLMKNEEVLRLRDQDKFMSITIGVDFGGNGSGHAFVCTGITLGYEWVIALASELHTNKDIDPEILGDLFVAFVKKIAKKYRIITQVWCDSAEPVLIRGLKKSLIKAGLGNIPIGYAKKYRINDRIFATTTLCAMNRFFYTEEALTLADAMSTAVWDEKKFELTRLDDGTSDIDTMDAFEYSFERNIRYLVDKIPVGDDE